MNFDDLFYLLDHRFIALAMAVCLIFAGEIGLSRGGKRRDAPESFRALMTGTVGAMLGLLGLLLGFTLAMAISRWDARRDIIVDESNAIGTLNLRATLIAEPVRRELRVLLRDYAALRIALGERQNDVEASQKIQRQSEVVHLEIWSAIEQTTRQADSPAVASALITAANDVIDIHEKRIASMENYLPASLILLLLSIAAVAIYFLAWSFGAAGRGGRTAVIALGLLVVAILFLIMDLNRPRRGTFQVGTDSLTRLQKSIIE